MMRATTMRIVAPLLASIAMPLLAQSATAPGPMQFPPVADAPAATAPPAAAAPVADAPIRSTLKPAFDPDSDGSRPRQRLVTVFGTEACPKPESKDEIIVCARLPEAEIYRIPKQLRAANNARVSPFQANRNLLLGDASGGAGGSIGSCSAVGAGGMIGCSTRQVDDWARDRAGRMGTEEEVPPQ